MADHEYSKEQIYQAEQIANALLQVPSGKRSIFALMIESMIIGAELAEKCLIATTNQDSA